MVLQLCPVLGDHTYSARVGTVLGQRFLLPAESTKPRKQVPKPACLMPSGSRWGGDGGQHLQTLIMQIRDWEAALLVSKAICSPILLCDLEQVTPPLVPFSQSVQ